MRNKFYKILIALGLLFILLTVVLIWFFYHPEKKLEIDFLDVGQGDSVLIKAPAGQNILIDGGPDKSVLRQLGGSLPWYDRSLDLIILTHPHDDHLTGLIEVVKRYQADKILYSGVPHSTPNYLSWLKLIKEKGIKLVIVDRQQKINLGQGAWLEIIYPDKSLAGQTVEKLNNSSIVIKLTYNKNSFLFVGDAETEEEQYLIDLGRDLSADVLKVGHHGSKDATSENFLAKVKPKIAVIEVGRENQFGHPNARTIGRLERIGAKIFRTDLNGKIKLTSDGQKIAVKTEK